MIAYKAFERGLIATRGNGRYQFKEGENITDKANCARNGFHCAEDPLDMFNYYSPSKNIEYRLVQALGDIDEDGTDSKIACTRLIVKQELTIEQVAAAALIFWKKNPARSREYFEKSGYFKMLRSSDPILSGKKGEWLCFAVGDSNSIERVGMIQIDGEHFKAHTYYDIDGNERSKPNDKGRA